MSVNVSSISSASRGGVGERGDHFGRRRGDQPQGGAVTESIAQITVSLQGRARRTPGFRDDPKARDMAMAANQAMRQLSQAPARSRR